MKIEHALLESGIYATVRVPDGAGKFPVIILCHGFCGIQDFLLPAFAERFVQAGYLTVCFDYHGFGKSTGERGRLLPAKQIADITEVTEWIKHHPSACKEKTGLWGTSLGGCHVFEVAAQNPEICFIISQLAFSDGEDIITGSMTADKKRLFLESVHRLQHIKETTNREKFVSVDVVLNDAGSRSFFEKARQRFPALDVKIPFLTVQEILHYKPYISALKVNCPVLVFLAENDSVNPTEYGVSLFNSVGSARKSIYTEPEADHYDVYEGRHFENIIKEQLNWLSELFPGGHGVNV